MQTKPRAYCGQHQCPPGDCFYLHYPTIPPPGARSVYLAGPMRGYPAFNFPAFDRAREDLRAHGYVVLCPAEHDRECGFDETRGTLDGFDLHKAFRWDVQAILAVDAVVVLPGWENSQGATLEVAIARAIGVPVMAYPSLTAVPE